MRNIILLLVLSTLLLLSLPTSQELLGGSDIGIGIGIGIGGGSNAPPPPSCPPPSSPPPSVRPSPTPTQPKPTTPTKPKPKPTTPAKPKPKPTTPAKPKPSPPTKRPLQPSDFVNMLQYNAYKVIQRFKNTITEDPMNVTKTWNGPRPCNYLGFKCDTPPGTKTPTIASVDFNGYHLRSPTVSGFIDQLPDLAIFHANSNKFSGTVPCLTSLPYLYELDFSNNRLTGSFPYDLLPLANLTFLDIRYNSLAGAVPPGVFVLTADFVFLNNNGFLGPLPANLGESPVKYLTLANNRFTGPIPASIGGAAGTLIEVLFLNNQLSGCLPPEAGKLRRATVFDAGNNRITGPIPASFGCLEKVEQLNLAGNLLYGRVPDVVCRLPRLLNLSLSENYFTSVGPSCYGLIKNKKIDVRRNCIPGLPGQRPVGECKQFLAKPERCPPSTFVSCALHRSEAGGGAELLSALSEAGTAGSVAYGAMHNPHGKEVAGP